MLLRIQRASLVTRGLLLATGLAAVGLVVGVWTRVGVQGQETRPTIGPPELLVPAAITHDPLVLQTQPMNAPEAAIQELAYAFMPMSIPPYYGASMRQAAKDNQALIREVLAYANKSPADREDLNVALFGTLQAFVDSYGPGANIPQEVLERREWVWGTMPNFGLSVRAYLLTELVRQGSSPAFARQVFDALAATIAAAANLQSQTVMAFTRSTGLPSGDPPPTPMPSQLGGEIAWCCEAMMVQLRVDPAPWMTPEASTICEEFVAWRTQRTKGSKVFPELPDRDQHETMKWVAKLAATIPAE